MKLICIDNNDPIFHKACPLTIGKEYECIGITKLFTQYFYCVIDDDGKETYRYKEYFMSIEEYRDKKLEDIGI